MKGTGNATPWVSWVKVVAAQMLFDEEEREEKKTKNFRSAGGFSMSWRWVALNPNWLDD